MQEPRLLKLKEAGGLKPPAFFMPMDGQYAARGMEPKQCMPMDGQYAARGMKGRRMLRWLLFAIYSYTLAKRGSHRLSFCKLLYPHVNCFSLFKTSTNWSDMTTSLYSLSVESYIQCLESLSRVMAKGETHYLSENLDPNDILGLRLCDDMMPFKFQVLSVIGQSVGTIASLRSGVASPPGKSEKMTFKQLHGLVNDAIEELRSLTPEEINGLAGGDVMFEFGETRIPFTAENYVLSFSLPNLYFHAATAYDLLRKEGVALGKRDFLGKLKMKTS